MAGTAGVGSLCDGLPTYVYDPPIEAVVFGWGVNEDGQLVSALPVLPKAHRRSQRSP